jgi:hypothetical protein
MVLSSVPAERPEELALVNSPGDFQQRAQFF